MRYYFESVINLLITIQQVVKHWHGTTPQRNNDFLKSRYRPISKAKLTRVFNLRPDKISSSCFSKDRVWINRWQNQYLP